MSVTPQQKKNLLRKKKLVDYQRKTIDRSVFYTFKDVLALLLAKISKVPANKSAT